MAIPMPSMSLFPTPSILEQALEKMFASKIVKCALCNGLKFSLSVAEDAVQFRLRFTSLCLDCRRFCGIEVSSMSMKALDTSSQHQLLKTAMVDLAFRTTRFGKDEHWLSYINTQLCAFKAIGVPTAALRIYIGVESLKELTTAMLSKAPNGIALSTVPTSNSYGYSGEVMGVPYVEVAKPSYFLKVEADYPTSPASVMSPSYDPNAFYRAPASSFIFVDEPPFPKSVKLKLKPK